MSNEEKIENLLMRNASCWSRVATPFYIDDLSKPEVTSFLRHAHMNRDVDGALASNLISDESAQRIYDLVGGRIYQLMQFKRDASRGVPFEETRDRLLLKDREKFIGLSNVSKSWAFIAKLWKEPAKSLSLSSALKSVAKETVDECIDRGIVKLRRTQKGVIVEFESKLTETSVGQVLRENAGK